MSRCWMVCLAVLSASCATSRGGADAAYARADYLAAADEYTVLAQQAPRDGELRARRDDARGHALGVMAAQVRALRLTHQTEPALTQLARLLNRAHRWPEAYRAGGARAVADEVASMSAVLRDEILAVLRDERPLAAEEVVATRMATLPFDELAPLWEELGDAIRTEGALRCRAVHPTVPAQAPYAARLTRTYCAHFGVDVAAAPLPDRVADLAIRGELGGMTAAQRARLDDALEAALRRTPWFDASASARVRVTATGTMAVAFSEAEVERQAAWSEAVHYKKREAYQQAYDEPYEEWYQQSRTVQVPCTHAVSRCEPRSEVRAHAAFRTAHRTAYRTAYRMVAKTRYEPRVFTYAALERIGHYTGAWQLATTLGDTVAPLEIQIDDRIRKAGDDHDARFAPARLEPSRAQLPSLDDWIERLISDAERAFADELRVHWHTVFCDLPSFDAETAARCAFGAALPDRARAPLAALFAGDLDHVLVRFAGR